jgi:hypothetical protein
MGEIIGAGSLYLRAVLKRGRDHGALVGGPITARLQLEIATDERLYHADDAVRLSF